MPKIGVIIGTTRANRFADKPAAWFMDLAAARTDLTFELLDLRDYPMPFFDEVTSEMFAPPKDEVALRWIAKLNECDGFVILAAEYNHGPSAVLKNALDYAYKPWVRKPVAFLGYGAVGGARAVEQLRQIACELQMVPIKPAVHIAGQPFIEVYRNGAHLADFPFLSPLVTTMLDDLSWWTHALKTAREKT